MNIIKTKDPTGQILTQTTIDKVESHLDERRVKKLYQVRQVLNYEIIIRLVKEYYRKKNKAYGPLKS